MSPPSLDLSRVQPPAPPRSNEPTEIGAWLKQKMLRPVGVPFRSVIRAYYGARLDALDQTLVQGS